MHEAGEGVEEWTTGRNWCQKSWFYRGILGDPGVLPSCREGDIYISL